MPYTEAKRSALNNFLSLGSMMSGAKVCPKGHICVWNANICTRETGRIWFGDLDLTTDAAKLIELARDFGEELYILREHDARFERENDPAWGNAKARVTADGLVLSP